MISKSSTPRTPSTLIDEARQEAALDVRIRAATILRSDAAKGRFQQAVTLALDTDMPADQAVALLGTAPLDGERANDGMGITDAQAAAAWAAAIKVVQ